MSPGALALRVVSEAASLRSTVEDRLGWPIAPGYAREGLLIGRPGDRAAGGTPTWILYESGDVVLRRSRNERDVVDAAAFHLLALEAATASPLLPLRLRSVLMPDGTAWLVDPIGLHDVAGHDRWYRARGYDILPTTIALVDPGAQELVLPDQTVDAQVPSGRIRVERILLRSTEASQLPQVDSLLALSAVVVRDPQRDLQLTLEHIDQLCPPGGELVQLVDRGALSTSVRERAVQAPG